MAGSAKRSNPYYRTSRPAKRSKFKSAARRFKLRKASKSGGYKKLSKRSWLLKNRSKLRGTYVAKSLGGKDSFAPAGALRSQHTANYQLPYKVKFAAHVASQQLVMQRKVSYTGACNTNKQATMYFDHMDNYRYQWNNSSTENITAEIPNMWAIAAGTLLDGGTYQNALAPAGEGYLAEVHLRRQRLYVKSYRCNYAIANTNSCDVTVSIYHFRHRKDADSSAVSNVVTQWTRGLRQDDNEDASATFPGSIVGFGNYADQSESDMIGAKPYQSKHFNRAFGTLGQRHVILKPGQLYNHTLHVKYNKYMTWEDCYPIPSDASANTVGETNVYLSNWTVTTLIVYYGQQGLAVGVAATPTTANAPCTLSVMTDETTKFYRLPLRSQSVFVRNDYDLATTSNMKIVQEDGDIVTPAPANA